MKKFMICSMMCLMTLISNAQVMTSATIDKIFDSASDVNGVEFFRNASRDANGQITTMEVYQNLSSDKDNAVLKPARRYLYEYDANGMLTCRTKFVWKKNQWKCVGRYDYSLEAGVYTATYSRWNKKKASFDEPIGQIDYTLLPDETVASVAYYNRHHGHSAMRLEWQAPVDLHTVDMNYYITQK